MYSRRTRSSMVIPSPSKADPTEDELASKGNSRRRKRKNDENLNEFVKQDTAAGNLIKSPKKGKHATKSAKVSNPLSSSIDEELLSTVALPKTKFQNAKRMLNSKETNQLPGREKELEQLTKFLNENLKRKSSASMYISGPPGTGKTACLLKLLQDTHMAKNFQVVYVNCTSISSTGAVFKMICAELKLKSSTEKENRIAIERHLTKSKKAILLVLDEVDQLAGKKQEILYTIFEWPTVPKSNLILIGIANSLDLTDRTLPRLNARCELRPILMHFAPYTKQQIMDIFKQRLTDAGLLDIFPTATIQLLAAKVAAVSGDIRRSLDIGRRVIELAEQQRRGKGTLNLAELDVDKLTNDPEEKVELKHVMSVLNSVYGASNNFNDDLEDAYPLQQKILICSLLLLLKKSKNKDVTIGRLHGVYMKICLKRNIQAIDQSEFGNLCSLVETRGIVRIAAKKEPRLSKIQLQWDENEVTTALKDKQLIASILDDTSCISV